MGLSCCIWTAWVCPEHPILIATPSRYLQTSWTFKQKNQSFNTFEHYGRQWKHLESRNLLKLSHLQPKYVQPKLAQLHPTSVLPAALQFYGPKGVAVIHGASCSAHLPDVLLQGLPGKPHREHQSWSYRPILPNEEDNTSRPGGRHAMACTTHHIMAQE
jgi:hypothetical protein